MEVIDMSTISPTDIFRSLRTDDCATFLALAEGQFHAVGDVGRSLLHEAIAHGKTEAARVLIERHAPVDARDDLERTPLHYAALFSLTDVATLLINAGADPNALDTHGNNPLWTAVLNPNIDHDLIRLLVQSGSSKASRNKAGRSVMDAAEIIGDESILQALENCE